MGDIGIVFQKNHSFLTWAYRLLLQYLQNYVFNRDSNPESEQCTYDFVFAQYNDHGDFSVVD